MPAPNSRDSSLAKNRSYYSIGLSGCRVGPACRRTGELMLRGSHPVGGLTWASSCASRHIKPILAHQAYNIDTFQRGCGIYASCCAEAYPDRRSRRARKWRLTQRTPIKKPGGEFEACGVIKRLPEFQARGLRNGRDRGLFGTRFRRILRNHPVWERGGSREAVHDGKAYTPPVPFP